MGAELKYRTGKLKIDLFSASREMRLTNRGYIGLNMCLKEVLIKFVVRNK